MDIQQIGVYIVFAGAIFYLAYRGFGAFSKRQCSNGCAGGCSTVDLSKINIIPPNKIN